MFALKERTRILETEANLLKVDVSGLGQQPRAVSWAGGN